MENNQKKKRGVMDASVVLSFVVAIFAVFSLAVFGIVTNQGTSISYAAGEGDLPDSFTFNLLKYNGKDFQIVGNNGSAAYNGFGVPMYIVNSDAANPAFCVQYNTTAGTGKSRSKGAAIDDYGLLYLLNNSYANGVTVTNATGTNAKYVEGWVTQTAIWMYLYEKNKPASTAASDVNYISSEDITAIKNATSLAIVDEDLNTTAIYTSSEKIYDKYVKPLVDAAKSATDTATLTASFASGDATTSEDGNYKFSPKATVTGDPSSKFTGYKLTVNSDIEGAVIVGEDGNVISADTVLTPGTNFYVRVPVDKLTKEEKLVKITVNGTFNTLTGNFYTTGETDSSGKPLQTVVSVKATERVISKGIEVGFVHDTGMNKVQIIYFIGLIVLLCGVGIVYANAKPVQVKE